jgi:hypothetical protein
MFPREMESERAKGNSPKHTLADSRSHVSVCSVCSASVRFGDVAWCGELSCCSIESLKKLRRRQKDRSEPTE